MGLENLEVGGHQAENSAYCPPGVPVSAWGCFASPEKGGDNGWLGFAPTFQSLLIFGPLSRPVAM